MENKVGINIVLKQETLKEIDELLGYYKTLMKYEEFDLPSNYEDFIKSAINHYINRLMTIHSFVISEETYKLNSNSKLKNTIKEYMIGQQMKQKDIAALTGIEPGALSNILSNRNQPSMDYFLRIWIALGCPPIEELFYRDTN
ncbi:helix-turn-helix transcriptional regulator [Metabacillus sp. Hm71]|uniref:helix-turn-helix transcriptional regulator n=1 Tax=Metabacillus sp. Hm71 TaxID=3450743 RepID=UPI003F42EB3E